MNKPENLARPLTWLMALLLATVVAGCGDGGDGSTGGSFTNVVLAPTLTTVAPLPNAVGVPLNTKAITAVFTKAMDPTTLTATNFTLACPAGSPITGVVSYLTASNLATLTLPTATNLPPNTLCIATVTTDAKDSSGVALPSNFTWSFTTGAVLDSAAPTVTTTINANGATGVALNTKAGVTFSEAMDPLTITPTTFTLTQGATTVAGTLTYSGVTAVFTPASNLAANTVYTGRVTSAAKDLAGNPLAVDHVWSWTTGTAADTTAPTVTSTINANGATNVAVNTRIGATFSEAMDPASITNVNFSVKADTSGTAVTGTLSFAGVNALFVPLSNLINSTAYTATIKGGTTGVKDLAGNSLATDYVWGWTTATIADTAAPTVSSTSPMADVTGVANNTQITATFSEAMDPVTLTTATMKLACPAGTDKTGSVSYSTFGNVATFVPGINLPDGTRCTATITTGASDVAGNALATGFDWSFTTAVTPVVVPPGPLGPASVNLGTAGNFAILAKTGISTVPASVITGDIGVSPAATSFLTGFSLTMVGTTSATSPQVTGNLYGADMTTPTNSNLTTAVQDMQAAYTDAAGRPTPDVLNLGSGEIGGQTLAPGLYKWTTGVTISSDVTLNGGADDVWILQIPGNLIMSAARNVILGGSAKARNIFWQVAGFVDIGTGAHFEGIMLSQTAINLKTGASMNGRALAQSAVTLDKSTVTKPAP